MVTRTMYTDFPSNQHREDIFIIGQCRQPDINIYKLACLPAS